MRDICCDLCLITDFFQTCKFFVLSSKTFLLQISICIFLFTNFLNLRRKYLWSCSTSCPLFFFFFFSQQHSRAHSMSWRTARGPTQLLYLFTPPKASTPTASTRTETRQGPKRPQGRPPAPWRPGCRNTRRTLTPPKERRSCLLSLREWHSHRWAAWYVFGAQFV